MEGQGGQPGIGVDAHGGAVVDPTANVLNLVEAAIKRQDDLRDAESRHIREIAQEHAKYSRDMAGLRAEYAAELRVAETQRIDAIRQVDVEAVQRAAEVQATQATALAGQVQASAEAMRNQVAAAATAAATALGAALEPIQKDIQDLRKAQYEAQGQQTQVIERRADSAAPGMWVALAVTSVFSLLSLAGVAVAILVR